MPKRLSILFSFCLALPAYAQLPIVEPSTFIGYAPDALVQQWLASGDPRLAAWAAHFILQDRRTTLLPDVEAVIEQWERQRAAKPATFTAERRQAMAVLLDPEIQLEGKLPAGTIAGLDRAFDTQRLPLLKNLPWQDAEPVWNSLYTPEKTDAWQTTRVAAQMLAQHPPAGFAAKLLASITVHAEVEVFEPSHGGGIGFGSSSCCGTGFGIPPHPDWPYPDSYALLDAPANGEPPPSDEALWLSGPDPIYLSRQPHGCGGLRALNDAMRSHLVGTLLGGAPASPFPEKLAEIQIEFSDRESYRATVASFVEDQQANFNQIATLLTARGLMTEEERQASTLSIQLFLNDFRKQPAVDLPAIAFRPPVQWTSQLNMQP